NSRRKVKSRLWKSFTITPTLTARSKPPRPFSTITPQRRRKPQLHHERDAPDHLSAGAERGAGGRIGTGSECFPHGSRSGGGQWCLQSRAGVTRTVRSEENNRH